jgi:exonuclease III
MLLSKRAKRSLLEWTPVSSRIITARFKSRERPISVIQCYAPTKTSAEETKEKFYGLLNTVTKIKKRDIIIVMGDLNVKIGIDDKGIEQIIGKRAPGERNDNGERFIELC